MATVRVIYEDGVFKPQEPVSLPEHAEASVLLPSRAQRDPEDPTGWKAIDRLMGIGKAMDPDASENHDDHLYGDPND